MLYAALIKVLVKGFLFMSDLRSFHQAVGELLRHVGFSASDIAPDQEVISLTVDERFSVHFGYIDHASWFMLADLGVNTPEQSSKRYADFLRLNQIAGQRWQPVVALDVEDRLCCWLRIPLQSYDVPVLSEAFDTLMTTVETLLASNQAPSPREFIPYR
ncbi:CesT family type III secretion system chaperone [Chitinimonas sp. PSY-7]|uniref:CesT family type III secretion system chaperone n=1 Tax=Chitinimonas sp. PSY-7 TaxID=3459088 RepID=UPI00403FEE40